MKLSIIIVSWNTCALLADCLHSVQEEIPLKMREAIETIVVDNASTDESVPMVRAQFPWVQLIENRQNRGFAGANNQAIQRSCGQYLLLLNPDTKVMPGAIGDLLQFMETHPEAGAVGPRLLNADGTLQPSCYPTPTLARECWRLLHMDKLSPYGIYWMHQWSLEETRAVDVIQGAALLLRRDALAQVGVLDEGYFIYSEEVDLCYRIQRAGWHLYWVPRAQVIHYGGQSTQQVAASMFLHLYRGKLRFFRKHHGFWAGQLYKLILLLIAIPRLLLVPLICVVQRADRRQRLKIAGNYGRLLRALPQL